MLKKNRIINLLDKGVRGIFFSQSRRDLPAAGRRKGIERSFTNLSLLGSCLPTAGRFLASSCWSSWLPEALAALRLRAHYFFLFYSRKDLSAAADGRKEILVSPYWRKMQQEIKRWNTDEIRFHKSKLNLNFNKSEEISRMLLELLFYFTLSPVDSK